jgi:hypothetical protein
LSHHPRDVLGVSLNLFCAHKTFEATQPICLRDPRLTLICIEPFTPNSAGGFSLSVFRQKNGLSGRASRRVTVRGSTRREGRHALESPAQSVFCFASFALRSSNCFRR